MTHTSYTPGNLPETHQVKNATELFEALSEGNGMGADALIAIGDEDYGNGRVMDFDDYDTRTRPSEVYTRLASSRGLNLIVDDTNHGAHEGFSYGLTELGEQVVRALNSITVLGEEDEFIGSDQQHGRLEALEDQGNLETLMAAYHHTPPSQLYDWTNHVNERNDLKGAVNELSDAGLLEKDNRMEENVANRSGEVLLYDTTDEGMAWTNAALDWINKLER